MGDVVFPDHFQRFNDFRITSYNVCYTKLLRPHGPLEVVVTICEEIGLVGAKLLDYSLIRSRRGLALDTSQVDRIIHKAPCANT